LSFILPFAMLSLWRTIYAGNESGSAHRFTVPAAILFLQ